MTKVIHSFKCQKYSAGLLDQRTKSAIHYGKRNISEHAQEPLVYDGMACKASPSMPPVSDGRFLTNLKIEKSTKDDVSFILTNKKGSYIYLAEEPISRYQGFFFFENTKKKITPYGNMKHKSELSFSGIPEIQSELNFCDFKMYKVIENINLVAEPITEIRNNFCSIERKRKNIVESFFMPSGFDSLVYELNKGGEIEITLDVKESYDNKIWGRYYEILEENNCIVIKFIKNTDSREDSGGGMEEYVLYLVIKSEKNDFEKIEKWVEHYYRLDEQRNSMPFTRYVFYALKLKGKKFVFSISKDKENAIKECEYIFRDSGKLKQKQEEIFIKNILKNNNIKKIKSSKNSKNFSGHKKSQNDFFVDKERKFAYISALNSLDNLTINLNKNHYMLAGLPWFFQNWSRDELISLKALILMKKYDVVKSILDRQISNIKNGMMPNKNSKGINSADSIGWLFKRTEDFKKISKRKFQLSNKKLKRVVDQLVTKYTLNNFAINNANETWMDSEERSGVRIEIQALRLLVYKMMYNLTKQKIYKYLEEKLKNNVRGKLWNKKYLYDGLSDTTIRPNIFLAYYIYPNLLTKKQWIKCFETVLKSLWLNWGGVATIDKRNPLFHNEHTGEDNSSYHKGDSWFWLNNLTALTLYKLDKNKFKNYINQILKASTQEILWKGAIGNHSELSSASNLKSQGCLMQAWSNAMYIELITEVHK